MDQEELTRHLEFECHAHNAALKSDAEQHGLPYEPLTFEEFARRRDAATDTSLEKPRLKPCPFCGGEPYLVSNPNHDGRMWHKVQCGCGTTGPVFIDHKHLAMQGWNKMCRRE